MVPAIKNLKSVIPEMVEQGGKAVSGLPPVNLQGSTDEFTRTMAAARKHPIVEHLTQLVSEVREKATPLLEQLTTSAKALMDDFRHKFLGIVTDRFEAHKPQLKEIIEKLPEEARISADRAVQNVGDWLQAVAHGDDTLKAFYKTHGGPRKFFGQLMADIKPALSKTPQEAPGIPNPAPPHQEVKSAETSALT